MAALCKMKNGAKCSNLRGDAADDAVHSASCCVAVARAVGVRCTRGWGFLSPTTP